MSDEVEDLKRRIGELEADLRRVLKAQEPKPEFKPSRTYAPVDWTAGMKMPGSATKAMADLVPDVKPKAMSAAEVQNSWARSKIGEPGGIGPPPERMRVMDEEPRRKDR